MQHGWMVLTPTLTRHDVACQPVMIELKRSSIKAAQASARVVILGNLRIWGNLGGPCMADHCTCMGGPHAWVDHMHMVDQMMVFKANFQRKCSFWDSRLYSIEI